MSSDSRQKMIASAASLIASRGVSATSFSDVLADSGAPRGSIYHHFPEGKRQLAEDAIRWTSSRVLAFMRAGTPTTPRDVLERFIGMWRNVVLSSHATSGCVVAGVAVDTTVTEEGMIDVVRETFRDWVDVIVEGLEATGVAAGLARPIAIATLAGMEGALILCRAEGSVEPLEAVATQLFRLLPGVTSEPA